MHNEIYNNVFDDVHIANNTQKDNFNHEDRLSIFYNGNITKQNKRHRLTTSQLKYFTDIYSPNKIDYPETSVLYHSLKDGGDTPDNISDIEYTYCQ